MNDVPATSHSAGTGPGAAAAAAAAWDLPLRTIPSYPGALAELPVVVTDVAPDGELALLHDGTPKRFGDGDLLDAVRAGLDAGRPVRDVLARRGAHGTVLDEVTVDSAIADARGVRGVLSVGSGTVSDLAKAVAADLDVPLVAVQTAASVNGYSDSLSVLVRNGAKRTLPTTWPQALVIDHDVLAGAPATLTRSGVGDAVAIWSAPADWYLANALGLDNTWVEESITPVREAAQSLIDVPPSDPAGLTALVDTLTIGGLGIGHTGTTAGLSGCEHLISHLLDMSAMARDTEHDLHGAQVGVASIVSAALWEIALEEVGLGTLDPAGLTPPDGLEETVKQSWATMDPSGRVGAECWTSVGKKVAAWDSHQDSVRAFFADWASHEVVLRRLTAPPETPAAALANWGAARRFSDLTPTVDPELARWTLRTLPYMRDRFTVADLLLFAGRWDDELLDRVLERAAAAGGGL